MIHTKLTSFKHLLKNSKHFLKSNWKKIVLFFLPLQIIAFASVIVLDLLPRDAGSTSVQIFGTIFGTISFLGALVLSFSTVGAPLVLKDIEDNNHYKNIHWYKSILKKIIPLLWIGLLVSFLNIAFITLIILISLIIFIIPSVIASILIQIGLTNLALSFQDVFVNNIAVGIMLCVLFIAGLISIVAFVINSYFAMYAFLMEERKGLDAITTSFLSVSKRRAKIFWRIIGIWTITSIPFLVLVFPIQAKIIYDGLRLMAIEVFLLQIPPAWPEVPANILVIKDVLSSIASILSLPVFVVLNYFLWKDVRTTTANFEEEKYNKTRKWIKRGVWTGAIIVTIIIVLSCLSVFSTGV